jgi:hypothetical protein
MWDEKSRERVAAKKIKDNAWVKQTDTDDTTSLSSHSNEISIGKTLSNISDVSAPSQASNWRYKNTRGNAKSSYSGAVEGYTSSYTSSRAGGQLASKLATESLIKKNSSEDETSTLNYSLGKLSSEDETSKLNYSLEKLIEDGEEETYSRTSMSSKVEPDEEDNKPEPSTVPVRETSQQDDSIQVYVDLSSRLDNKISTVSSTDSSLVYSMGNTVEPCDLKKFTYSYSYDVSEDPNTSDLVASTLAECRLLLEMSPPPTPLGGIKSPVAKRGYSFMSPLAKREYAIKSPIAAARNAIEKLEHVIKSPVAKKEHFIKSPIAAARNDVEKVEMPPIIPVKPSPREGSVPSSAASSPASVASLGLGNFLKCPCCRKEFTNDMTGDKNRDRRPLHSFACDHIVCYGCVFQSTSSDYTVACPQCGEARAFDKTKPVVSRSYCNLVKSLGTLNSARKGSSEKARRSEGVEKDQDRDKEGRRDRGVPHQIRFSPNKDMVADPKREANEARLNTPDKQHADTDQHHQRGNTHVSFSGLSEMSTNTSSPYPEEPDTPVSRAEYRFMQRKEKLAQSLEKVNRLLERSKMTRNEFTLKSIEEDLAEKKDTEDTTLSVNSAIENNRSINNGCDPAGESEYEVTPTNKADYSLHETLNESVRVDGDIVDSAGFERPKVDTLWTDEGVNLRQPREQKRIKPELRVDTGNYTPLAHRKNPYLDLKDESTTVSSVNESQSRSVDVKSKSGSMGVSVNDIFRSPMSPQMNFEALENRVSSEDSSLTDRDNDNRFLLGNSVASKSGGNSLVKEKKYGVHRPSPLKDGKVVSSEKQRMDEHRCPQFLPSLTYSTMQDTDEFVGLVRENNGMSRRTRRSGRFTYSHSATPSKMFRRQSKSCKGVRLSFGKAESFDESSLVRNQNQRYEFTQHSCSFSPSDRSLRGALVTHKPKLHKRIFSKLAFRKNPRLYSKR